jgi:glycosyltransferase involved in cell wall biosynthesis
VNFSWFKSQPTFSYPQIRECQLSMPLVTVILSTYNWSAVLPFSIESVLHQTFRDFELLVIGDGCSDDSAEVVAGFSDLRVRWINLPRNTGSQAGPNNEGLRQAKGKLIAYLGHDDLWSKYHLENLVAFCKDRVEAFATAGIVWFDETSNVTFLSGIDVAIDSLQVKNWKHIPSGVMHSHSLISKIGFWTEYNARPDVWPDREFFSRMEKVIPSYTIAKVSVAKVPADLRKDIYKRRDVTPQRYISAELNKVPSFVSDSAIVFLAKQQSRRIINVDLLYRRTRKALGNLGLRYLKAQIKRGLPSEKNAYAAYRKFKGLE